jgi:hypothetical protein
MTGPIPGVFEHVPRGLFGPLGDPYAELYWDVLARLYRSEFEREPFFVLRAIALDIAEQAIRDSGALDDASRRTGGAGERIRHAGSRGRDRDFSVR